jgi:hypothetical protein
MRIRSACYLSTYIGKMTGVRCWKRRNERNCNKYNVPTPEGIKRSGSTLHKSVQAL